MTSSKQATFRKYLTLIIVAMAGGIITKLPYLRETYMEPLAQATGATYTQLGLIMLIGLASKNAILMVEYSKVEREKGVPIKEAAMRGADQRYRAVLMTAISFLFGVFPLVVSTGAGAGSRRAIGITTFSGMLAATVVGIFFIPAYYSAIERMREGFAKLRGKQLPEMIAEKERNARIKEKLLQQKNDEKNDK